MFPGIDHAAFAAAFVARLRAVGVDTGVTRARDFSRALTEMALTVHGAASNGELYWTARITLISRPGDIAAFDAVFAAVFGRSDSPLEAARQPAPLDARDVEHGASASGNADAAGSDLPWVTLPAITAAASDDDAQNWLPEYHASDTEAFADKSFADFDTRDLQRLDSAVRRALAGWPARPSRRHRHHRRKGPIAMRATITRARRTGWETVEPVHRLSTVKRRRLVMLCDVSQSMQPYTNAYLHFMRVAARMIDCEVFAFATRLTRLTPILGRSTPGDAIERANAETRDRFGGTRIASSLRSLLHSHHGDAVRGAIVVVASDGWDGGPPEELAVQMARVRRRAHRIVWFNPRAGQLGYEARVGGMAAALPYCDHLLPAHTVSELIAALTVVAGSGRDRINSRA